MRLQFQLLVELLICRDLGIHSSVLYEILQGRAALPVTTFGCSSSIPN